MRKIPLFIVLVSLVALAATVPVFIINGKQVKLDTVEKGGKVYVDALSFAKALGAQVTYDKAKNQFVIVTTGKAPTEVAGTTQLAGGEGELGKTYTLGKRDPLNFTLRSAEFTVSRVTIGTTVYAPKAGEKLLVLHYTVQNPQKQEENLSWRSFKFTAVDSKDVNQVFDSYVAREGTTESLDVSLKPAQKIDVVVVWPVPAAGVIPKLIVERGGGDAAPVLRYDLRGKVKPLSAPFADPADASGSTALEEVPVKAGSYYPLKYFDLRLETVSFTTDPMNKKGPEGGRRYLVATIAIKNAITRPVGYSWGTFKFELKDADGEKTKFNGYLIKAGRDEHAEGELKPGEEYRFRVYFELPQDLAGQTLYVAEGDSRTYAFDISSFK